MSTLEYYEKNAAEFIAGSAEADMSDVRERFLRHIPAGGYILDLGCGSGRDALAFHRAGYNVTATDGSAEICRLASELTGLEVRCLLFEELDYVERFDGVWACASLLHVPKSEMHDVLCRVSRSLKPGGTAYLSYKYGTTEREKDGRFFSDYTEADIPSLLTDTGLTCTEWWLSSDVRPDRTEQWLNILARAE